ncbi:hypothetical protein [Streptomyces syringium]|uniref:hypothetical protein n=1 Tax=Streptomyces syringium TaxID=76729 RepID=UPI003F51631E
MVVQAGAAREVLATMPKEAAAMSAVETGGGGVSRRLFGSAPPTCAPLRLIPRATRMPEAQRAVDRVGARGRVSRRLDPHPTAFPVPAP